MNIRAQLTRVREFLSSLKFRRRTQAEPEPAPASPKVNGSPACEFGLNTEPEPMKYEVDFLPVGQEYQSGDAICFRYWGVNTPQFVGIIDGGTGASGQKLVTHIRKHYGTETVDLVINTHPHAGHTSGLYTALEQLNVKCLMMNRPWAHALDLKGVFRDGRISSTDIDSRIRDAIQHAFKLEAIANKYSIPIIRPEVGPLSSSPFVKILGPTEEYYREILHGFSVIPDPEPIPSAYALLMEAEQRAEQWAKESWNFESLNEPTEGTNACNNSSIITLLDFGDARLLFTGDAGVPALERCCAVADRLKIPLQAFKFVQIPGHGNKHNVGPAILNRLIGGPVDQGTNKFTAFVSAPLNAGRTYASKAVTNAFIRRGTEVIQTNGSTICYHGSGVSTRVGQVIANQVPFFTNCDEY